MADYLRLTTAHGDDVAVASGVVVACRRPYPADVVPLVACRSGGALVLTANGEDGTAFALEGKPLRTPVVFLGAVVEFDGLALIDPGTRTYLTGRPLLGSGETRPLTFMTDEVEAREYFATAAMRGVPVHPDAAARIGAALRLLDGALDADGLGRFLALPDAQAAGVLDASLPLLPTRTLDELAARLMADAALRSAFAHAYPADPWAQLAVPALADWLRGETRPGRSRHDSRTDSAQRRQNLDCLGVLGACGEFASLPHACNARARRATKPHRGPAVLATARNEGIYLLEWIAYHRLLGAEAIFIYSNDNQDGSELLLGALADAGVITWVDSDLSGQIGNAQFKAYGHALGCMPDLLAHDWVLVIDIDEFLVLDQARYAGLAEFCAWHDQRGADTVAINWQFMAPEEVGDPFGVPLTRRNMRVLSRDQCGEGVRLVKSMSRPNRVVHSEAHVPFTDERSRLATDHACGTPHLWRHPPEGSPPSPKFADYVTTGSAVINHYLWESSAEFLWKMARNRGDSALQKGEAPGPMREANAHSFMRCLLAQGLRRDKRATDNMPALQQEMARLTALAELGDALNQIRRNFLIRIAGLRAGYAHTPELNAWDDAGRAFLRLSGCLG